MRPCGRGAGPCPANEVFRTRKRIVYCTLFDGLRIMKQQLFLLSLLILSLQAADFWQAKPYTEWNEREVQRVLNNSPWAREAELSMGGGPPPGAGAPEGGRGGRGGPAGDVPIDAPSNVNVVLRWQTALPIKQAMARQKFGSDGANSVDAKAFLDHEETAYLVEVSGVPSMMMAAPQEQLKSALKSRTALSVKGKGILSPSEVQIIPNNKTVDVYFSFPRGANLSLDDKEVEFSTRIGFSAVRSKFRLKDMVFNGKLEL
jgi:hypothetical protein